MNFTRNISRGMTGDDVLYAKQRLVELGFLHAATKRTFGDDTLRAVKKFQKANNLGDSGEIDAYTWDVLFGLAEKPPDDQPSNVPGYESLDRYSAEVRTPIIAELQAVSETRRAICLDALNQAIDPNDHGEYPRSLYIRGGNLYNPNLTPNVITIKRIRSGAQKQPEYYDRGRQEMMERAVQANPLITGADCSGGVVGLLRHEGIVIPKFDRSADGFNTSSDYTHITRDELMPGDLLHKPGHLGIYVGGNKGVEWMGGEYGCQLTDVDERVGWSYVDDRPEHQGDWVNFLRAKRW